MTAEQASVSFLGAIHLPNRSTNNAIELPAFIQLMEIATNAFFSSDGTVLTLQPNAELTARNGYSVRSLSTSPPLPRPEAQRIAATIVSEWQIALDGIARSGVSGEDMSQLVSFKPNPDLLSHEQVLELISQARGQQPPTQP